MSYWLSLLQALSGWRALGALIALCLAIYPLHPLKRWEFRHIPGPPPTWLIGNLLDIVRLGPPMAMQQWAAQYGPLFKVWQGGTVVVIVEDPEAARLVNTRNHDRPGFFLPFIGEEMEFEQTSISLAKGGPYAQALRQAWQGMFVPESLRGIAPLMNAAAERLVDVLAAKAGSGEAVEMYRLFGALTMEIVGSTSFGVELRALDGAGQGISSDAAAIEFEASDDTGTRLQKAAAIEFGTMGGADSMYVGLLLLFPEAAPLIKRLAGLLPDPALRKWLQARRVMRDVCFDLIADARRKLEPSASPAASSDSTDGSTAAPSNSEDGGTAAAADREPAGGEAAGGGAAASEVPARPSSAGGVPAGGFVGHLLRCENKLIGRPFTDTEVAAQLVHFLLAGYDTSAAVCAFATYHIARCPRAQAAVLAEVDACGGHAAIGFDDLEQFPYLDAVLNETLRLTPPGAFGTIRVAREGFQLCGRTIRKGWLLNTAQYSFHNNPRYWEQPQEFRPERFLAKGDAKGNPAFAPFGNGRSCVGARFATAQAKVALIRMYQRYTLQLLPGQEPLALRTSITMAPRDGVLVHVQSRA